jgi:hypothetical protein
MSLQHNTVNTRWQHLRPCRGLCSLSGKMKVKRMSSVSCFFPDVPSIVTTLRWSRGKSGCWAKGNPSCGFCGSMMSNSAHCRIINCPRVEAIGTFQRHQSICWTALCLRRRQEDGLRLRANILTSLPYLRSLYPSIATSLLAKVSHMSFYTKLITEQQK